MKDRSKTGFVYFRSDVKSWIRRPPSVEEARPGRCPWCGAASRPTGDKLQLHGHGLRERQLRGPLEPEGRASLIVLLIRRYLCRVCGGVATVVPQGVVRGRLFSASAIALALALFGIERMSEVAVRKRTSPWTLVGATAAEGWLRLRRWVRAIRDGRLFSEVHMLGADWTARHVAVRAATVLAGRGPSELRVFDLVAAAFVGATQFS